MSIDNEFKLKRLLQMQPQGVVWTTNYLVSQGYSNSLLQKYRDNQWLEAIGHGAMKKKGEGLHYLGGIFSLQKQLNLSIHPGAKTALTIFGRAHFLQFGRPRIYLFGETKERLPSWFLNYDWGVDIEYFTSSFLPKEEAMSEFTYNNYQVSVASPIRALLQCLYLVPKKQDLEEAYQFMLGLTNLRPDKTQTLLEKCSSIKVNRLFLYLAEKSGHTWYHHIDQNKINLGQGDREIIKGGVYNAKYKITVPKALEENA